MRFGNTIQISWDPVSLEEAKGFFVCRIRLIPEDSSNTNTANTRTVLIAFNVSLVNITNIHPQLPYTVSISALLLSEVGLIEGPTVQVTLTS